MRYLLPRLVWTLALASTLVSFAKVESWTDVQGNAFKGEASEVLGPLAVFRGSTGGGRRIPWRMLSPADCVRFQAAVAKKPARADDWTKATSELTSDLVDCLRQRQGAGLVKASLAGRPEPLLLVALYADNSESKSWDMLGKASGPFQELVQKYPGQIEGIQLGMNHSKEEHQNMAQQMNVPWLVVDYAEQSRVQILRKLSPPRGEFGLVVLTRNGIPIFSVENPDEAAIQKIFADAGALLDLQRPGNPQAWPERAYYVAAIQPAIHANDAAGPVLVGDPIVPKGLRDRKIYRLEAKIEVGVDGKVTQATIKEDASIPPAMATALVGALQKAVFVPAVDHGKFVAGTYDYRLEIPR